MNWPTLDRAPIVEALIDMRVELPEGATFESLAEFPEAVSDRYPTMGHKDKVAFQVKIEAGEALELADSQRSRIGHVLTSADKLQVVQARTDGFTFSRLKEYGSWQKLRDEAVDLWKLYVEIAKPQQITRIAVRYINAFEVLKQSLDLREWNLSAPQLAPSLPSQLSEFFVRLVVPFESEGARAIITLASAQSDKADQVKLIFDIDVFQTVSMAPGSTGLWERFEALRDIKNRVFFSSIPFNILEPLRHESRDNDR